MINIDSDNKTKSAVERQLGIIGEAVSNYRKIEKDHTLTATRRIVSFRNRIIHSYDKINDAIIWAIMQNNLQILKAEVEIGLKL